MGDTGEPDAEPVPIMAENEVVVNIFVYRIHGPPLAPPAKAAPAGAWIGATNIPKAPPKLNQLVPDVHPSPYVVPEAFGKKIDRIQRVPKAPPGCVWPPPRFGGRCRKGSK